MLGLGLLATALAVSRQNATQPLRVIHPATVIAPTTVITRL
jgi:hypothetical protein